MAARDSARAEWNLPLGAFEVGLAHLLGSACQGPGRWILIAESGAHGHHFWQSICFEDGSLIAEFVSNFYLEGLDRLTDEQEAQLVRLDWESPRPPGRPNWLQLEPTTSPDVAAVARRAAASLRRVFRLEAQDGLKVKLFASERRGGTPAEPEYLVDENVSTPRVGG